MPLGMFVNPVPGLKASNLLQFDFPARGGIYKANGTQPNINLLPPAVEQLYGLLGTPPREQGNPFMAEIWPEIEDPQVTPFQDQIIDIDREVTIYHTGRLSGSLVPFFASNQVQSTVRIDAVQNQTAANVPIDTIVRDLTPAPLPTKPSNTWFWLNNPSGNPPELLFTACTTFDPATVGGSGLIAGELYKLNIRWEFRFEVTPGNRVRLGISGFDETIAFQVSERTYP